MPQGIICPPLGNASRHHSPPAGECLKASFPPAGECLKASFTPCWGMPQGIIHPLLGNASRHHSPPGECLKASFTPCWGMPQGIIHPLLGNASRHHSPPAGECLKATFALNRLTFHNCSLNPSTGQPNVYRTVGMSVYKLGHLKSIFVLTLICKYLVQMVLEDPFCHQEVYGLHHITSHFHLVSPSFFCI